MLKMTVRAARKRVRLPIRTNESRGSCGAFHDFANTRHGNAILQGELFEDQSMRWWHSAEYFIIISTRNGAVERRRVGNDGFGRIREWHTCKIDPRRNA